jgi:hypothetical protein
MLSWTLLHPNGLHHTFVQRDHDRQTGLALMQLIIEEEERSR